MQNVFSSLETYKKFMLMKYEAEKSLTFFKISNNFRMLKIERGERDPRITGALEVKQWLPSISDG